MQGVSDLDGCRAYTKAWSGKGRAGVYGDASARDTVKRLGQGAGCLCRSEQA